MADRKIEPTTQKIKRQRITGPGNLGSAFAHGGIQTLFKPKENPYKNINVIGYLKNVAGADELKELREVSTSYHDLLGKAYLDKLEKTLILRRQIVDEVLAWEFSPPVSFDNRYIFRHLEIKNEIADFMGETHQEKVLNVLKLIAPYLTTIKLQTLGQPDLENFALMFQKLSDFLGNLTRLEIMVGYALIENVSGYRNIFESLPPQKIKITMKHLWHFRATELTLASETYPTKIFPLKYNCSISIKTKLEICSELELYQVSEHRFQKAQWYKNNNLIFSEVMINHCSPSPAFNFAQNEFRIMNSLDGLITRFNETGRIRLRILEWNIHHDDWLKSRPYLDNWKINISKLVLHKYIHPPYLQDFPNLNKFKMVLCDLDSCLLSSPDPNLTDEEKLKTLFHGHGNLKVTIIGNDGEPRIKPGNTLAKAIERCVGQFEFFPGTFPNLD